MLAHNYKIKSFTLVTNSIITNSIITGNQNVIITPSGLFSIS